jgi:hypothetical protein
MTGYPDSPTPYCIDANGAPVLCSDGGLAGQDGDQVPPPDPNRFVVDAGVIFDGATGLTWEEGFLGGETEISVGATHCQGLADAGLGGLFTWRLPRVAEQLSVADYGLANSNVIPAVFPNDGANMDEYYWLENTDGLGTVYYFSAETGAVYPYFSSDPPGNAGTRCVAPPAVCDPTPLFGPPSGGIVPDKYGRSWQQVTQASLSTGWPATLTACQRLSLGGKTWRVPTIKELALIWNAWLLPATYDGNSAPIPAAFDQTNLANATSLWSSTPNPSINAGSAQNNYPVLYLDLPYTSSPDPTFEIDAQNMNSTSSYLCVSP